MNYESMSDKELIHYLDLYATDPLIRRLANMLHNTRGGLIADLEAAGMDPDTWRFETEWQSMYPGDYIQQLRRDIEELESDLEHTKYNLDEMTTERDELKTRSIMDFIQEVHQEKQTNAHLIKEAMATVKTFKDENDKLREKIDMWGVMNRV